MMQQLGSWVVPLTFIPAVGLIIMSTSARFSALSAEIGKLRAERLPSSAKIFKKQIKRARLFSNALVSLYLAVASFALGALLAGLGDHVPTFSYWALMISVCFGVLFILYSTIQLIIESIISRKLIELECTADWL